MRDKDASMELLTRPARTSFIIAGLFLSLLLVSISGFAPPVDWRFKVSAELMQLAYSGSSSTV